MPTMTNGPELIQYVTKEGKLTGLTAPKLAAHNADTKLHLAFSCYIFNGSGQILITQRALSKKVWPGVWTNSVCGHPLPGESMDGAILRRAKYELGLKVKNIQLVLPEYIYKTPPFKGVVEHEYCPVHVALAAGELQPNPDEVENYQWVTWDEFVAAALGPNNDNWSYWTKDQIPLLTNHPLIKALR